MPLVLLGLLPAAAGPSVAAVPAGDGASSGHSVLSWSKLQSLAQLRVPPERAPRSTSTPGHRRVPILMYHALSDPPAGAPFPELYVRPSDFAAQMRWLDRQGYRAVTLRAVWEHWHDGVPLPSRPVVVSIDDGFRSTALVALPELRRRGWPGVLNLALHHLDVRGGISSRQVRGLIDAGWEIAAHTLTHPDLMAVSDGQLAREVAGSRTEIRRQFGVPVDFFCYPAGRYDERVVAAVRRAGFLGATTTLDGLADRNAPFTLRRVRVSRSDGLEEFAANLARVRGG